MRIALLSPQSPAQPSSSAVARMEMFAHLPKGWQVRNYYFGAQANPDDTSIGTYLPEGHPGNLGSLRTLLSTLTRHHQEKPFDCLWVTLPPIMMALFAVRAKRKLNLPLIVDVRDPGISSARLAVPTTSLRYKLAWLLERWVYRNADAICCVTPELAEFLQQEFGVPASRCHIISNAGPYKKPSTVPAPTEKQPLHLFYAGTFAPYQVLRPFLEALLAQHASLPPLHVTLFGYQERGDQLPRLIAGHEKQIELHERAPRETVFTAMQEAHAVLVPIDGLDMPELYQYAIPLKYYEALAHSKPILLFGGTAASRHALERDKAGVHCPLNGNLAAALEELRAQYAKYQKAAAATQHLRSTEAEKLFAIIKSL